MDVLVVHLTVCYSQVVCHQKKVTCAWELVPADDNGVTASVSACSVSAVCTNKS